MGVETYLAIKVIIGAGAAATAAAGAYAASGKRRALRRRMREAPKEIDDLAVVTLVGTVKQRSGGGEPLVAPLSGKACVAYRASAGDFATELAMTPFTLVTAGGEVLVDGTSCEIAIRPFGLVPRRIELEQAFLNRKGIALDANRARFDEVAIVDGARIAVYGVARVDLAVDGETTYRDTNRRIRIVGDDAHPLTFDDP